MRISSFAAQGMRGWPDLELASLSPGLNVVTGPARSGKSTLAELLGHALYGKLPTTVDRPSQLPEGEAVVEAVGGRFRLRRYHDGTQIGRLTVASLAGEAIDRDTVRRMLGGVSSALLGGYFTVDFASAGHVDDAAAAEFALQFHSLTGGSVIHPTRRTTELAAHRDALAQELETRIAQERRASSELGQRRRELERQIRDGEEALAALELRLRSTESALAETDARLRYRRLELNVELRWQTAETDEWTPQLIELDAEIARWRATLADLSHREAAVRSRLARLAAEDTAAVTLSDQRAWAAVARQLAADLEGEVARLARAAASQKCVCSDSHPRLRPIVETLSRQLDRLDSMVNAQQRLSAAQELSGEAEHLVRSQAELRQQLEHLLDRRQALTNESGLTRRRVLADAPLVDGEFAAGPFHTLSAADAEQLEQRRLELEQKRFDLIESLRRRQQELRNLRAERSEIERQRAALLSARSIEHVQRELAVVQGKLEQAANGAAAGVDNDGWQDSANRASDYLAQLSDGRLVRLELAADGAHAWAIRQTGERVPLPSLGAAESDQVRLSFSLAIVAAVGRQGIRLPLVLDEPFLHADDQRELAAIAAVLDAFAREGHQVIVFTSQSEGVARASSLGAPVYDLVKLRRWRNPEAASENGAATALPPTADILPQTHRRVRPVARRRSTAAEGRENTSASAGARRKPVRKRSENGKSGRSERGAA